jgi:hypothetical protein
MIAAKIVHATSPASGKCNLGDAGADFQRDTIALLREIRDLLADRKQRQRALNHAEHSLLHKLLPAIFERHQSAEWTISEVMTSPVVRSLIDVRTPSALGILFTRATGDDFEGYRIKPIGQGASNTTLWVVSLSYVVA